MTLAQDLIDGAQGIKDVAAGAQRRPFDYSSIDPEFANGEHIDNPNGGPTVDIDAKAGDNRGSSSGEIELVHFGRVYIDVDAKFAHVELEDDANIDLAMITGGRAAMHRAALMRECLLQAGYLHAITWAMDEASKSPPGNKKDGVQMLDQIMGMVGDLVGGDAAGQLTTSTLDLNPLIAKCNAIGGRLNQAQISYPLLHKAGCDLHDLRAETQAFLDAQVDIENTPATPPPALLGGLPLIGDALKNIPFVGDALEWSDKILGCSVQLVGRMTLEMHLKMATSINAATRDISIDAIRQRRPPVFNPWWKYPEPSPPDGDSGAPDGSDGGGMKIDLVEEAQKLAQPVTAPIDSAVKEYTSLFQLEDISTPGDAFIDMAFFLNPQGSLLDRAETMATYGGEALSRVVAGAEGEDTSFTMPPIVTKVASYIFQLVSEFVRSVFKKLLVLGEDPFDNGFFDEALLAETGRTHLLTSLMDWPLKELDLDQYIDIVDQEIPSLSGGDPVRISTRGLFENLRRMLIDQLAFMDPAIAWAMKSFHSLLKRAHDDLSGPHTRSMEPYLALIPTLHATMFRNLLLPFWEAMQNAVKQALASVLGPVLGELGAGGFLGDAYRAIDTVQQIAARVDEAQQFLAKQGARDMSDVAAAMALGRDTTDPNVAAAFGSQGGTVGAANPFAGRVHEVSAAAITQADRDEVEPDKKWDPEATANEDGPIEEPAAPAPNGGTP